MPCGVGSCLAVSMKVPTAAKMLGSDGDPVPKSPIRLWGLGNASWSTTPATGPRGRHCRRIGFSAGYSVPAVGRLCRFKLRPEPLEPTPDAGFDRGKGDRELHGDLPVGQRSEIGKDNGFALQCRQACQ